MTTLTITRGLPGSGKTTWAKQQSAVRVNRDDLRFATYGKHVLATAQEDVITLMQQAAVRSLLAAGRDVVVDDTNLNPRTVRAWQRMAREEGADFKNVDFDVPSHVANRRILQRAAAGGRDVPPEIVKRMQDRYLKNGFPEIKPLDAVECAPYVPDQTKPTAWIFDVDGTLTTGPKDRSPYEWKKVWQDDARWDVVAILRRLRSAGDRIIVVSGRDGSCADETLLWFTQHGIAPHAFHMRAAGDMRRDDIVKAEIFDKYIRDDFYVMGVFDDRDQVVKFWRSIGLTCFQVAEGNF